MKRKKFILAVGRPRAFDAGKALDCAMQVFWRKGYIGASLSDLTKAMGINRPSLYAAFGNKETLFFQVLDRYLKGPSGYLHESLKAPTARGVAERMFHGVINLLTDPKTPATCLWVHSVLSCGDGHLRKEFTAQRSAAHAEFRTRFKHAIREGDLPADADAATLAHFVMTVNFGLTVQASTGATRKELLETMTTALKAWPT
jgi:AcrR family transcriptional regulator